MTALVPGDRMEINGVEYVLRELHNGYAKVRAPDRMVAQIGINSKLLISGQLFEVVRVDRNRCDVEPVVE